MLALKRIRSWKDEVGCWLEDQKENWKRQRAECDRFDHRTDAYTTGKQLVDHTMMQVDEQPAQAWVPPCFRHRLDGLSILRR
eukprot:scaffold232434_cov33-Tisochrysis_lutea.AAC.1